MQVLLISKQKQREWADGCYRTYLNVLFTQMSEKQVTKQFKEREVDDIVKDYKQPHDMNAFGRVCPKYLTPKQKRGTLRAITSIKEKWYGKINERVCADDRSQLAYITKEESTAPTVSMDSLLALLIIDAFEERAMAIFDVPDA